MLSVKLHQQENTASARKFGVTLLATELSYNECLRQSNPKPACSLSPQQLLGTSQGTHIYPTRRAVYKHRLQTACLRAPGLSDKCQYLKP